MIFIKSISISILFFTIISLLPHLYLKQSKPNIFSYVCNLIGYLILTVLLYSCYVTNGNTVMILTIPVFLFLILKLSSEINFRILITKNEIFYLSKLLLLFGIIYIFQFSLLFEFSTDFIKLPHPDYLFYSNVATNLNKYHIESYHMSPLAENIPYHYFELWLTAFFNHLGLKSYITLLLVVYPIIITLCSFVTYLIIKNESNSELKCLIISLSILVIQLVQIPIIFNNISFLNNDATVFIISVLSYQKISIILLLFLFGLLIFKKSGINNFITVFSICISLYSPLILGVIGFLGAIITTKILNKNSKVSYQNIALLALSILLFNIFYKLNHYSSNFDIVLSFDYFKTIINIIGGSVIRILAFTIPFILFILSSTKAKQQIKNNYELIFILMIACFASLLGWGITYKTLDSVQLFTNFSIPIMIIGITLLVFNNLNLYYITLIIALILGSNTHKYFYGNNINELSEISKLFNNNTQYSNGAFIKDASNYQDPFLCNPYFSIPLNFLFIVNDNTKIQDISLADINTNNHKNKKLIHSYLKSNEYYQYKSKNSKGSKSSYIKSQHINFIISKTDYKLDSNIINLFKHHKKINNYDVFYKINY